jgi:hypothetical protein
MTGPRDDELGAMLAERADRVPDGTDREVLAAVHREVQGRAAGAGFAVLPVAMDRRGGRVPTGWVALGFVAVLVIAVLGGRLEAGSTRPGGVAASGGEGPSASPRATADGSASAASDTPQPAVPEPVALTASAFRDGFRNGTLNGTLVLVDGHLEPVALPCPSPAGPDCFGVAVAGLDGVSVTWDGPLTRDAVSLQTGRLAFVPHGEVLIFIGRVEGDLAHPSALKSLVDDERLHRFGDPFALTPVIGWLVIGGIHSCPMLGPGATPCPGPPPTLTGVEPFPDGMLTSEVNAAVEVWPGAVGIGPRQTVTRGPFLYRAAPGPACDGVPPADASSCPGGPGWSWQIVARLDPERMVRVSVP